MRNTNIHPTDNLPFHCNHYKYVFFFYNDFISLKSMATILRKTGWNLAIRVVENNSEITWVEFALILIDTRYLPVIEKVHTPQ